MKYIHETSGVFWTVEFSGCVLYQRVGGVSVLYHDVKDGQGELGSQPC